MQHKADLAITYYYVYLKQDAHDPVTKYVTNTYNL